MPAKCRLQNISCRQRAPLVLLMNNLFMPAWFHEFAALCYAHAVSSTENIGHPPHISPTHRPPDRLSEEGQAGNHGWNAG